MLRVLILLGVLSFVACSPSNRGVGIGLIHFEKDYTTVLKLYDKPGGEGALAFSVNLVYEDDSVVVKSSLKKEDLLRFNPIYENSAKGILVLQVMEQKDGWLRVVTDDKIKVHHWIRSDNYNIGPWKEFLKSVFKVAPKRSDQNPLRKAPRTGEVLPVSFYITCFSVVSINGDWIRVENNPENCNDLSISNYPYAGFLRWKKGDEILIKFRL